MITVARLRLQVFMTPAQANKTSVGSCLTSCTQMPLTLRRTAVSQTQAVMQTVELKI